MNMENDSDWISKAKVTTEWLLLLIKTGGMTIGCFAVFSYSNAVGYFPEDISLGNAFTLYFLSIGVFTSYCIVTIGSMGVGSLLFAPICLWLARRSRHQPGVRLSLVSTDFSALWNPVALATGALGILIALILYLKSHWTDSLHFLGISVFQGMLVAFILLVRRETALGHSPLALSSIDPRSKKIMQKQGPLLIALLVSMSVVVQGLLGPKSLNYAEAAFRMAQLRKDNTTIHVKAPWHHRIVQSGIVGSPSFLGPDYLQFDHVPVLLTSFGSKTIIQLQVNHSPQEPNPQSLRLAIPKEMITVE